MSDERRVLRQNLRERLDAAERALREAADLLPVAVDGPPLTLTSQLQAAIWTVADIKRRVQ